MLTGLLTCCEDGVTNASAAFIKIALQGLLTTWYNRSVTVPGVYQEVLRLQVAQNDSFLTQSLHHVVAAYGYCHNYLLHTLCLFSVLSEPPVSLRKFVKPLILRELELGTPKFRFANPLSQEQIGE